jgi:hypothetical protein
MRRASAPVEILLGLPAGCAAGLFVEQPVLWLLHYVGFTHWMAFGTIQTAPLGVEQYWAAVVWDGAFGMLLAAFGTRYFLGTRWAASCIAVIASARTAVDWFVVPFLPGHVWTAWTMDRLVMPVLLNTVTAAATVVLLAIATLAAGTWGSRTLT